MTRETALHWLAMSRTRGILPGLDRIRNLLALLGHPEKGLLIVHVAGTNGKGSVCALLESALRACGHRTGLFTSPWLVEPEEMFRIDGVPISQERFAGLVSEIEAASRPMVLGPGLPTEYESYAAMAFLLFRQEKCSAVVLETCMGGRFDTTNAYEGPNLAVLTKLSLDHTAYLGGTLPDIAWHKAGIFRHGCGAVSWPQEPVCLEVIRQEASLRDTSLECLESGSVTDVVVDASGTSFHWTAPRGAERWSGTWQVGLQGTHQAMNAALSLLALSRLSMIPPDAVRRGLREARWPCRFEILPGTPPVIIDGAHNPDGMQSFADTFRQVFPGLKATVVFGVLRDKDVRGMLALLLPLTERLILVAPDSPRALPVHELEALLPSGCCVSVKRATMEEALEIGLLETPSEGVIAAVGSLTWIGRFKANVQRRSSHAGG